MRLTDVEIRAAQAKAKPYKLFDERGLFQLVTPTGARLWRLKYSFEGREKLISLGDYRDVPLRRAREKRDAARRLVADGKDPSAERQAAKAALSDTLEAVAREWLAANEARLAPSSVPVPRSPAHPHPHGTGTAGVLAAVLKPMRLSGLKTVFGTATGGFDGCCIGAVRLPGYGLWPDSFSLRRHKFRRDVAAGRAARR